MAMKDWGTVIKIYGQRVSKAALDSVIEVLTEYSTKFETSLKNNTPRGETSGLVNSIKKEKVTRTSKIGYRVFFDGYDKKGRPYQVIANSLNRGFTTPQGKHIPGNHFIDNAKRILKEIDPEISKRWKEKINKEG